MAKSSDKNEVLEFCKSTFSWGDYISHVWDFWMLEGNLLVLTDNNTPVAICHCSLNEEQLWIEGIRVNKNFRRKGYATHLIKEAELIAKKHNCKYIQMLIAIDNQISLELANSLDYKKYETWNFYSILPMKNDFKTTIKFASNDKSIIDLIFSHTSFFVKSWRWLNLSKNNFKFLLEEKKILYTEQNRNVKSIAIVTTSEYFKNTLMLTIAFGNEKGIKEILSYIQNYASQTNYEKIQILTKLKNLPKINSLEKKLSFYLMKKEIK
ncbi:MAG TPA: GNAT family N-acetyltransferase [Nitrosopumilaceae archaeon]|nr:GNAT family N-acetyltransferase [Nitrosopumilaceae archaeon]